MGKPLVAEGCGKHGPGPRSTDADRRRSEIWADRPVRRGSFHTHTHRASLVAAVSRLSGTSPHRHTFAFNLGYYTACYIAQ
jgi:hypothetical protein